MPDFTDMLTQVTALVFTNDVLIFVALGVVVGLGISGIRNLIRAGK
ncbi:MAG: hypothetical protein N2045_14180 [Fimbriimonadales bacterium]|nr:hypothetical protein [Fimbriimonadales bacterium]